MRLKRASTWRKYQRFNPRTRVGCDLAAVGVSFGAMVSIHAPVWGATYQIVLNFSVTAFQSTHPCGVRQDARSKSKACHRCFNPRTRVGCDQRRKRTIRSRSGFNPRTRVGCDGASCPAYSPVLVSIHAPVWGATCVCSPMAHTMTVSIHAPVWGAT